MNNLIGNDVQKISTYASSYSIANYFSQSLVSFDVQQTKRLDVLTFNSNKSTVHLLVVSLVFHLYKT